MAATFPLFAMFCLLTFLSIFTARDIAAFFGWVGIQPDIMSRSYEKASQTMGDDGRSSLAC